MRPISQHIKLLFLSAYALRNEKETIGLFLIIYIELLFKRGFTNILKKASVTLLVYLLAFQNATDLEKNIKKCGL